jgi:polyferredoxin
LQLLYDGHYLSADFRPAFGGNGVVVLLAFYAVFNAAVFSLVAVFGRRFFCSMLCVNFGAHAETLKEGFPLFGSRKRMKERYMPALRNLLAAAKWGFLAVNLLLMVLWAGILAGAALDPALLRTLELVKYLALELFLVLGAFVVLSGRTYCYYCPSGTMLSLAGKATGHGIRTNVSACIDCGRCNEVCDMEIDIRGRALQGEPVRSVLCVGCGACVDACPAGTLEYL